MNIIFNRGLDEMRDWTTADFLWLLAQEAYTPDRDHDWIADVTDEVTVASYVRVAPSTKARSINDTTDQVLYTCDNPDFGDLEDTENARWLILAKDITNDADSPLIAAFDLGFDTTLGDDFVVHLHPTGFLAARQVTS